MRRESRGRVATCRATLALSGRTFVCDLAAPHPGLAHTNAEVDADWCSHGEAARHGARSEAS